MPYHHSRSLAFIALASLALSGFAARGVLQADGILRVKGVDPSTTSITVVPGGAASYTLPGGTSRFVLLLPLDDVYLISVSGEGCPTKEIYFDARVPSEMHAQDFTFPFMVTLEHLTPERMFVYAGPVGFVSYLHPLKDFGYQTQYAVHVDERLKLRMEAMRATGSDPQLFQPAMTARVVDLPRGEYNSSSLESADAEYGSTAPLTSSFAHRVHVVEAIAAPAADTALAAPALLPTIKPIEALAPSLETTQAAPMWDAPTDGERVLPYARSKDNALAPIVSALIVVSWLPERTEELITEARMITRIVRFTTPSDGIIEFRKVTHAFGAVYYFLGVRSITERAFDEATAPTAVSEL